jgi:hypothetical protein
MKKPIKLQLNITLPKDKRIEKMTLEPNGDIAFFDKDGNSVVPPKLERIIGFDRTKGTKVQTRHSAEAGLLSLGGLAELAEYEKLFAIDTNTRAINGVQTSAACFLVFRLIRDGLDYKIVSDDETVHVYEFQHVTGNPELLGVLKLAVDVSFVEKGRKFKMVIVNDSSLGNHGDVNARKIPLYADCLLPNGFTLAYASADTGGELLNKLIRCSNQQSTRFLRLLEAGKIKKTPYGKFAGLPYRYHTDKGGLKIIRGAVKPMTLEPGATYELYGRK